MIRSVFVSVSKKKTIKLKGNTTNKNREGLVPVDWQQRFYVTSAAAS